MPTDEIPRLPLRRTPFCTPAMVRAVRGLSEVQLQMEVDCGRLLWVWNVAANSGARNRDLRFWAREVIAPEMCILLTPTRVVGMLLGDGTRQHWSIAELSLLLMCSKQHVHDLIRTKALPKAKHENKAIIPRAGLQRFLTERMLN